jgi:predicted permease
VYAWSLKKWISVITVSENIMVDWNCYILLFVFVFFCFFLLFFFCKTRKCADQRLERQIRCFSYVELSDVPRLWQKKCRTGISHYPWPCPTNFGNSGFASPTLCRQISTFCGYRILFSTRNPYINRFTNHFSKFSSTCLCKISLHFLMKQNIHM